MHLGPHPVLSSISRRLPTGATKPSAVPAARGVRAAVVPEFTSDSKQSRSNAPRREAQVDTGADQVSETRAELPLDASDEAVLPPTFAQETVDDLRFRALTLNASFWPGMYMAAAAAKNHRVCNRPVLDEACNRIGARCDTQSLQAS